MTRTSILLYWLLVVCGLAGLTFLRIDDLSSVLPLWLGTVAGVAVGQAVAWLRIRTWILVFAAIALVWGASTVSWQLPVMSSEVEDTVLAFVPALICGWFSMSERGGLAAFWYPGVLWMMVVLDDPKSQTFDLLASAPFVVGLGLLFVAFLRARETRRVALWQREGSARLSKNVSRTTLSASPLRTVSDLAWTATLGGGALVVAAWIAPQLWQKEEATRLRAQELAQALPSVDPNAPICCPEHDANRNRSERVTEYFPLVNQEKADRRFDSLSRTCTTACRNGVPLKFTSDDPVASTGYAPSAGGWGSTGLGHSSPGDYFPSIPAPHLFDETPAAVPTTPTVEPPSTPAVAATPPRSHDAPVGAAAKKTNGQARVSPGGVVAKDPGSAMPTTNLTPSARVSGTTRPAWEWMLTACAIFVGLQLFGRGLRRALTLRHLAHPFWREPVDQQISNHWHRMLVGLRDAGIHPAKDEAPKAFARRVGIEGMSTCATILERVRHGVRLAESDLHDMSHAAALVFRTAQKRAGVSGRLAAQLRWPLA